MTEDAARAAADDYTHSWAFGALADAYHLPVEDQEVIAQLRPGTAMLVGVGGPVIGSRLLLSHVEGRVGRNEDCLVWLPARSVSRHHATLVRHAEGYELVDAGSLNGSWVNHRLVDRCLLRHGDEVQFGGCRFLFIEAGRATPGHLAVDSAKVQRTQRLTARRCGACDSAVRAPTMRPVSRRVMLA